MPDKVPNATCWRCGLPSHMKFYITKRLACTSTTCSLCKARAGGDNHDARYCCYKSLKVFPNAGRSERPAKRRNTGKGHKPGAGRGKSSSSSSSSSRPNHISLLNLIYGTHGEAVKDVPKDVVAAMVILKGTIRQAVPRREELPLRRRSLHPNDWGRPCLNLPQALHEPF